MDEQEREYRAVTVTFYPPSAGIRVTVTEENTEEDRMQYRPHHKWCGYRESIRNERQVTGTDHKNDLVPVTGGFKATP
jgi:hypothetical protein